ncbi:MAG: hypothetical protein A2Y60_03105 [Chloroflexi bacterium RBG_13_54_9]|nr:MAG: hypothetical protein A2Y60_03105 [Chloroflexi bacterium RBG_13_54_9]
MIRRKRFLIGGIVILLAVAYLGYRGFEGSATYYLTVSEVKEQGGRIAGENVRVNGRVAPGSVDWDAENNILRFVLVDEEKGLSVLYKGIVPDAFKADSNVVVEGGLESDGIFHADAILTRCPSKYAPEE